jgi:hypothetical protein
MLLDNSSIFLFNKPIQNKENVMETNHWGKWVNSEEAVTGVIQNNHVEWLNDEIRGNDTIDLDYEEYIRDIPEEIEEIDWDSSESTLLIGSWKKDEKGLYEPDKEGEYSAIVSEIYTQVVWSKYTKRCNLCSPCYPGQGDLDTPGEWLAYTLPPDLIGNIE